MLSPRRKIVLVGPNGVGKTTIVKDAIARFRRSGIRPHGFYTEHSPEIHGGAGFVVRTMDGTRLTFAHIDMVRGRKVGPYRVDVDAFEAAVLPSLEPPSEVDQHKYMRTVGIVDEIGKLQCVSDRFMDSVERLLKTQAWVLVTVPDQGGPFVQAVHTWMADALVRVDEDNRDTLAQDIVNAMLAV